MTRLAIPSAGMRPHNQGNMSALLPTAAKFADVLAASSACVDGKAYNGPTIAEAPAKENPMADPQASTADIPPREPGGPQCRGEPVAVGPEARRKQGGPGVLIAHRNRSFALKVNQIDTCKTAISTPLARERHPDPTRSVNMPEVTPNADRGSGLAPLERHHLSASASDALVPARLDRTDMVANGRANISAVRLTELLENDNRGASHAANANMPIAARVNAATENMGIVTVQIEHRAMGLAVTLSTPDDPARNTLAVAKPEMIARGQALGLPLISWDILDSPRREGRNQKRAAQKTFFGTITAPVTPGRV